MVPAPSSFPQIQGANIRFMFYISDVIYGVRMQKNLFQKMERPGGGVEFLPFNRGPRICLRHEYSSITSMYRQTNGYQLLEQFAHKVRSYTTVRLLPRFDIIENADTDLIVRHSFDHDEPSSVGCNSVASSELNQVVVFDNYLFLIVCVFLGLLPAAVYHESNYSLFCNFRSFRQIRWG
jgi:hypothetical protein